LKVPTQFCVLTILLTLMIELIVQQIVTQKITSTKPRQHWNCLN